MISTWSQPSINTTVSPDRSARIKSFHSFSIIASPNDSECFKSDSISLLLSEITSSSGLNFIRDSMTKWLIDFSLLRPFKKTTAAASDISMEASLSSTSLIIMSGLWPVSCLIRSKISFNSPNGGIFPCLVPCSLGFSSEPRC
ncbi:hypothetical protein D3C73_1315010 [compost metagenome]